MNLLLVIGRVRGNKQGYTDMKKSGEQMKPIMLKYVILISLGAVVGGVLGWLSRCAGGGA